MGLPASAALLLSIASAQPGDEYGRTVYRELRGIARTCAHERLDLPPPHVIREEREAETLIRTMLPISESDCPGVAAAARARLVTWLGEIARADVDLDLLSLLHGAASRGLGGPRDPGLAERARRILWLLDDRNGDGAAVPALPAWASEPEAVDLLRANVASRHRSRRATLLLGTLSLRRDGPRYDPAEGLVLLERSVASIAQQLWLTGLLTDGVHTPPDPVRAARVLAGSLRSAHGAGDAQLELLRIGRLAVRSARTPIERAAALRILWAAALDGLPEAAAERDSLLRRIGRAHSSELAAGDVDRIAAAITPEYPIFGVSAPEPPEQPHRPVRLRALIGPDGRAGIVELLHSSGSPIHDRAMIGIWAIYGDRVDLGATARGRFVWAELPPIAPRYAIEPR
jgi:hypothetical protein